MDTTIAPSLDDIARERLRAVRHASTDAVTTSLLSATLALDAGRFGDAQGMLVQAVNDFAAMTVDVPTKATDAATSARDKIVGYRYQTCAVRSCLDAIVALANNPRATSFGERLGHLMVAAATLRAVNAGLRAAA